MTAHSKATATGLPDHAGDPGGRGRRYFIAQFSLIGPHTHTHKTQVQAHTRARAHALKQTHKPHKHQTPITSTCTPHIAHQCCLEKNPSCCSQLLRTLCCLLCITTFETFCHSEMSGNMLSLFGCFVGLKRQVGLPVAWTCLDVVQPMISKAFSPFSCRSGFSASE